MAWAPVLLSIYSVLWNVLFFKGTILQKTTSNVISPTSSSQNRHILNHENNDISWIPFIPEAIHFHNKLMENTNKSSGNFSL